MRRLVALIVIVSHVLINAAWASSHVIEDVAEHGHDAPHIHLSTLLSAFGSSDTDDLHDHNFEDDAHIHLILYITDAEQFVASAAPGENLQGGEIPFFNPALSPPVPPPTN